MAGKKPRTLEENKSVTPKVQNRSKAAAPGCSKQSQKFLDGHSGMADEGAKSTHR